jgi:hypothetical protein
MKGKQMKKETKLRIHNITSKVAFKFGREAWVLKKKMNNVKSSTDEIFLRHLLRITKLDK